MLSNNNLLFFNIIKNASPDFKSKEELFYLHKRILQLESSLKMRRNIEYEYNKLKIDELNEKIDDNKFQKKYILKRNKNILEDIEKHNQKAFELSSRTTQTFEDLVKNKERYEKYLESLRPKIFSEFNKELFSQNNVFVKIKYNEEEKLKKNENKNDYYDELTRINENLVKEIKALKKRNESISLLNKEKEKIFKEKEEELKNKILINYENEQIESKLNENNMKKDRINNNEEKIILRNQKICGYHQTIKQLELNRNHKFGKLDEIKQKEIDIINAKIKQEFFDKNKKNELNNIERDSLNDIRPQLYDPNKQFTNMGNMSNTLFQNNEISSNNNKISNVGNNNIEKPTPDGQNNINNLNNVNESEKRSDNLNNPGNQNNNINDVNQNLPDIKNDINNNNNVIAIDQIPDGENHEFDDFQVDFTEEKN